MKEIVIGAVVVVFCCLSSFLLASLSFRRSRHHTLSSGVRQLMLLILMRILGYLSFRSLNNNTKNASKANENTLLAILNRNKNSEYGKLYNFDKITSKKQFKEQHPITRYDHYEPYVQKILDGQPNVMTGVPLRQIATTSGTSGSVKLLPMTENQRRIFFYHGVCLAYWTQFKYFPSSFSQQKVMKVMFEPELKKSKGGLLVGPNSSRPSTDTAALVAYSSPMEIYTLTKEYMNSAKFLHLLWALIDKNLGGIEANFAGTILDIFIILEANWRLLVKSIKEGTIPESISLPQNTRQKLASMLKPDPQRASELEKEFEKGTTGIIRRIWPYFNCLLTCDTGSAAVYGRCLKKYTSKSTINPHLPEVLIYSPIYGASEGLIGVAIDPAVKAYVFSPTSMFVEFIPVEHSYEEPPSVILDLEDVKINHLYELVLTTYAGLCRYRFGDVVKIHSFYNQSPVFEFQYRQGQNIDLHGEKTSEHAIYMALTRSIEYWNKTPNTQITLIDYTTAHHITLNDPLPRYHIFIELAQERHIDENEKEIFDKTLCEENMGYKYHRDLSNIYRAEISTVKSDTFKRLHDVLSGMGSGNVNQIKIPRLLKLKNHVEFIVSNVYS